MIVNKKCEKCDIDLFSVNHQTRYCEECRKESIRKSTRKYDKKAQKVISKNKEIELINNFNSIVKESFHLTPLGFNEVSELSYHSYQNFYVKPWIEILKIYGRYNNLVEYVISEYKKHVNETNKQGFRAFSDNHNYITTQLTKAIGEDKIRNELGLIKKRNTIEDCKNEFCRLVELHGRIPLYSEFLASSKISLKSYKHHLKINSVPIYDQIVRCFTTDQEYEVYLTNRQKHKAQTGRDNHQGYKYSDQELKNNLVKIFDTYYKDYNAYPSRRLFNEISPIDDSVYRNRFNAKWTEVCKLYGYEIEDNRYKSEKIALGVVSEILNEEYEPQKTFEWLIGFKGFPLFCDGYFPNRKLIVEFDGDQHRYPIEWFGGMDTFHDIKTNDKYKDILSERNGYRLIRISSEEPFWDKEYIKNKLKKHKVT